MKKLIIFFGILLTSLVSFGQYTSDKTPANLTKTTTLSALDWLVVEKSTDNYVKAITAYDSYVYYRRCLDSIVDLNVSGDLNVVDRIDASIIFSNNMQAVNMFVTGNFVCAANSYFTDMVEVQNTLFAFVMKMMPLDTISSNYCLTLDPTDSIIKLAPMGSGTGGKLLMSNVAHVNYDASTNDTVLRIFKTYAEAITWISTQTAPTDSTKWTVVMSSGYCDEAILLDTNIYVSGQAGTFIRSVGSSVEFVDDYFATMIRDCWIDTLYIYADMITNVEHCKINLVVPDATDGKLVLSNSDVYGGSFDKVVVDWTVTNCRFVPLVANITNMNYSTYGNYSNCSFADLGSFSKANIKTLPRNINASLISVSNLSLSEATSIHQSRIFVLNNITTTGDMDIIGCSVRADTIFVDSVSIKLINSSVNACAEIGDTAEYGMVNTLQKGNIAVSDSSSITYDLSSRIDGTLTLNNDSYKNDDINCYAEIYYADASTPQTIGAGVTYKKWTAFTNDGEQNVCQAVSSSDKITITRAGTYYVMGNFSTSCGTNGVVARTALFVDNTEVAKIHKIAIFSTQNVSQSGSISGIITVSEADVPVDIDVRVRHDNVGNVNFTGIYGNLSVYKIGY